MITTQMKIQIVSFITLLISVLAGMVLYLAAWNGDISPMRAVIFELIFVVFGIFVGLILVLLFMGIDTKW